MFFLKLSFALLISYSYGIFISLVSFILLTLESLHISIMVGHKWPDSASAFTPQMCEIVTNIAYAVAWSLWKLSFMVIIHFKAAQSFFLGQQALNKVSEIVNY